MKLFERIKRKLGFTLQEALIVVGIITVLTAIAIPSVIKYYRSLHLAQLDNHAQAIFVAAQNKMTALVNAGEMDLLLADEELTPVDLDTESVHKTGAEPLVSAPEDAGTGLYYITSKTDKMSQLLPAFSIEEDLRNGYYVVEYFPNSGTVYAVWYVDKNEDEFIAAYESTGWPRGASERLNKSLLVGYYGGNDVDRPEVGQMPLPQVELINAEELVLKITLPESELLSNNNGNIRLDVTLDDGTKILDGAKPHLGTNGRIVLDTLKIYPPLTDVDLTNSNWEIGCSFKNWLTDASTLKPGDDITVTVRLYYEGTATDPHYLPQVISVSGNSLFAGVSESGGEKTVNIAYGRHLQNLDNIKETVKAVQVKEIDFAKTTPDNDADDIENWAETYPDGEGYKTFAPLSKNFVKAYDGKQLPIRNLSVEATDHAGLFGTYESGTLKDIVLINPSVATHDGSTPVGSLVSTATDVTISGCQVYLEKVADAYPTDKATTGKTAGGLVGAANNCTITGSSASTVVAGSEVTGGLVGQAENVTVTNSYAAGYLFGDAVGGLIGSATGTVTVQDSYAAGTIAEAVTAAGICPDALTAERIYAAVRYAGAIKNAVGTYQGDTKGFYIAQSGVTFTHGQKTKAEDLALTGEGWFNGANPSYAVFPYNLKPEGEDWADLQPPYPYPMLKTGADAPMFHYGDWLADDGEDYLVYYEKYYNQDNKDEYGFYALKYEKADDDKPQVIINTLKENKIVTEDGYALLSNAQLTELTWNDKKLEKGKDLSEIELKNQLSDDEKKDYEDLQDYYVYPLPYEAVNVTVDSTYYREIKINDEAYYYNPHFACEAITVAAELSERDKTDFIKTIQKKLEISYVENSQKQDVNDAIVIRSARQLANVQTYTNSSAQAIVNAVSKEYSKMTFHQLLDIDYAKYTGYSDFKTGTASSNPQTPAWLDEGGVYDGHEHTIKHLYITGDTFANGPGGATETYGGLFGIVYGGQLKNIRLVNVSVNVSAATDKARVGGLVGNLRGASNDHGTVDNCGIYVENTDSVASIDDAYKTFSVRSTGSDNLNDFAGGLIGSTNEWADISNSFAAVMVRGVRRAGGFAGNLNGFNGTDTTINANTVRTSVTNCYSAGHTRDGAYAPADEKKPEDIFVNVVATSTAQGFVGGFTSEFGAGVKVDGVCYSTCSVGVMGLTDSHAIGSFVGRLDDWANASSTKKVDNIDTVQEPFINWRNDAAENPTLYATGETFAFNSSAVNNSWANTWKTTERKPTVSNSGELDKSVNGWEKHEIFSGQEMLKGWKDSLSELSDPRTAKPYDGTLLGSNYPYVSAQSVHHGDWVEPKKTGQALDYYLVYYEMYDANDPAVQAYIAPLKAKYDEIHEQEVAQGKPKEEQTTPNFPEAYSADGKYVFGFYAVDGNNLKDTGTPVLNTLAMPTPDQEENADERIYVLEDGYAVIYYKNGETFSCAINYGQGPDAFTSVSFATAIPIKESSYFYGYIYPLPAKVLNMAESNSLYFNDGLYKRLTIGACDADYTPANQQLWEIATAKYKNDTEDNIVAEYYFNPYLACEAVNVRVVSSENSEETRVNSGFTTNSSDPLHKPGMVYNNGKDYSDALIIRSARQLAGVSMLENFIGDRSGLYKKMAYDQLMDIDFKLYEEKAFDGSSAIYGGTLNGTILTGKSSQTALLPLMLGDGTGVYDGHDFVIRNLYVGNQGKDIQVGLFQYIQTNSYVKNIRLVNLSTTNTSSKDTGGLVGEISGNGAPNNGDAITNCGIYVEPEKTLYLSQYIEQGKTEADYLADYAKYTDEAYYKYTITGNGNTGGLIGVASDNLIGISNSFASVKVTGKVAGGFVGSAGSGQNRDGINNCYSGGHTSGGSYLASAPNVTGTSKAGGFAGEITGGKLSGTNYSTCSAHVTSGSSVGKFAATVGGTNNATIYALGDVFTGTTATLVENYSGADANWLTDAPVGNISAIAYDSTLTGNYPYESGQSVHHGDWPVDGVISHGIFYWERKNNTYAIKGVSAKLDNAGGLVAVFDSGSLLPGTTGTIDAYGYGYYYLTDYETDHSFSGTSLVPDETISAALSDQNSGYVYKAFTADKLCAGGRSGEDEMVQWTLTVNKNAVQVYLNPDFADTVQEIAALPESYAIRSYDQLTHINNREDYLAKSFKQSHDVTGSGKDGFTPIGNADLPFTGTYDGNSCLITDLTISSDQPFVGLFGVTNQASLKNITLFSTVKEDKAEASIVSTYAGNEAFGVGGLVGAAMGGTQIHNSAVANYEIVRQEADKAPAVSGAMGGLVGWGDVTITNSSAVVTLTNDAKDDSDQTPIFMGGVLGSGKAVISSSYSGGLIQGSKNGVEHMAGIVASGELTVLTDIERTTPSQAKVENCYTYCAFDVDLADSTTALYHLAGGVVETKNSYFAIHESNIKNVEPEDGVSIDGAGTSSIKFDKADVSTLANSFKTYAQLKSLSLSDFASVTAENSHPVTALDTDKYPFKSSVKRNDAAVHYGDWPKESDLLSANPYKAKASGGSDSGDGPDVIIFGLFTYRWNNWQSYATYAEPLAWSDGTPDATFTDTTAPTTYNDKSRTSYIILYKPGVEISKLINQHNNTVSYSENGTLDCVNASVLEDSGYQIIYLDNNSVTNQMTLTYRRQDSDADYYELSVDLEARTSSTKAWYSEDLEGDIMVSAVFQKSDQDTNWQAKYYVVPATWYGTEYDTRPDGASTLVGFIVSSKSGTVIDGVYSGNSEQTLGQRWASFSLENGNALGDYTSQRFDYASDNVSTIKVHYSYSGKYYVAEFNLNNGNITSSNYTSTYSSPDGLPVIPVPIMPIRFIKRRRKKNA